jgi:pimeloyl-ACP methyl ester carboxylesterase
VSAESQPIVLIPGLLCTSELYVPQLAALWRFGPVTIADHRRDESMDGIVMRILAAAPPRFSLVGLSMGGYLALAIMHHAAERVTRLALLDTSARADQPAASERRKTLIALARAGRFDEIPDIHFPSFVHKNRRDDVALKAMVRRMAADTGPEAYIRQQIAISVRDDRRDHLSSIRCPTLVVVGDGDELTPPELAREMTAAIPDARLAIIADCGHLSTLEQPDQVTTELTGWMTGW